MSSDPLVPESLRFDGPWTVFPALLMAFDLDDTLAPSKSPLPTPMAALLVRLLQRCEVCIISGGRFEQFQTQILGRLDAPTDLLGRLHLMPTCGTQYVRWQNGGWIAVYSEDLSTEQKDNIRRVLEAGARSLGLWEHRTWGPVLEDRGSQLTFSALGQSAPVAAKSAWDPGGVKRSKLREYVAARLPELSVQSGGSTSIDVTRLGVDKAYGMRKLMTYTGYPAADIMFVGDRLDPGGNDHPVLATGVRCVEVSGWEQTVQLLQRVVELPSPAAPPA
jgi:phosphomannomutase